MEYMIHNPAQSMVCITFPHHKLAQVLSWNNHLIFSNIDNDYIYNACNTSVVIEKKKNAPH